MADRGSDRLARLGVAADLLLTAILTAFLLANTWSAGDAVPRPYVIAALYGTPGLLGIVGIVGGRRPILVAASGVLLLGSLITFSGVALVFLAPAILLLLGSAGVVREGAPGTTAVEWVRAILVAALVLGAGYVVLFGTTIDTCATDWGGLSFCTSAGITMTGVALGAAMLLGALVVAALPIAPPEPPPPPIRS